MVLDQVINLIFLHRRVTEQAGPYAAHAARYTGIPELDSQRIRKIGGSKALKSLRDVMEGVGGMTIALV